MSHQGDEPGPQRGTLDVIVLDMNHGYPNLGHASIVETLLGMGTTERQRLGSRAPELRVISYDVRRGMAVPVFDPDRYPVVVGTGGPGALDPRLNDGVGPESQGVVESSTWEAPLWRFFDEVIASDSTALLGICHSFGLLSRWSGVAEAELRGAAKGKSSGVVTNVLSEEARVHPWFGKFFDAAGGADFAAIDSRLFDMIPTGSGDALVLAHEKLRNGTRGTAVTMLEFARRKDEPFPRVWGVNYHPEIGDRGLQRERLNRLEARGEMTEEWLSERRAALDAWNASAQTERGLQYTSEYTFEAPLRYAIAQAMEERSRPRVAVG